MDCTDRQFYNLNVLLFVMATYIIDFSYPSTMNNSIDSLAMIFHIQPVSYILSVTIHRQGFSFQDILYNKRNQFFRKMIRTIIIGTTGNAYRHFISIEIRFYK